MNAASNYCYFLWVLWALALFVFMARSDIMHKYVIFVCYHHDWFILTDRFSVIGRNAVDDLQLLLIVLRIGIEEQ